VLLHGYGETGDMWVPLASDLMRDYRVIVPDLRGLGLSSKPSAGYDKKTQAGDLAGVLASLGPGRSTWWRTTSAIWSPFSSRPGIPIR
jgi:pimeloyl-ACP methyl ester carboxylesterase